MNGATWLLLALLSVHGGWLSAAGAPAATALKITAHPQFDGKLDETFWHAAVPLNHFHVWKDPGGRRVNDTQLRLAYDDTWLYVGAQCGNPLQKLLREPKVNEHDGGVNEDESIELFFVSAPDGKVYYHFILSCFNVRAEQRFINGNRERHNWNLPWRSATMISDTGWSAEIAIPLFLFIEHGDLDQIRLNVMRNRREPFQDEQMVVKHETLIRSVWQLVENSFHELESFGSLAPLDPGVLQMPFLVSLERVEIQPYFMRDGVNHYGVEVEVRGANMQAGDLVVAVTDQPAGGEARVVRQTFRQNGTSLSRWTMAVPAPAPSERTVVVELMDAALSEVFQTRKIENPAALQVMDAYLDRNYYTTEEDATAVAAIAMPPEAIRGMLVAVEMGGRTLVAAPAAAETMASFAIKELEPGRHPVTIVLRREDGARFYAISTDLVKRAPNPGREWKIDQVNRVMLRPDGNPIFPFGPVMGGVDGADKAVFQAIANAGCNTYMQWGGRADQREVFEPAAKHGLYVVFRLCAGSWLPVNELDLKKPGLLMNENDLEGWKARPQWKGGMKPLHALLTFYAPAALSDAGKRAICGEYFEKTKDYAAAYIESIKHHENLMAWNSIDEPYGDPAYVPQCLADIRSLTHRVDGYRPLMLLYSSNIPKGDEWVKGATDILCTDPYWIPAMNPEEYGLATPNYVSKITHWNDQRAAKFRQPVWSMPVGALWSGMVRGKRIISGPEQHCQNFLAIIHGARGLFWFSWDFIHRDAYAWSSLRDSIAMVKVIGPMAVQKKVRQHIRYLRANDPEPEYKAAYFIPERDEYPDVQGRLFRDPENDALVLVAANSRYYPVTATFIVAGLSGSARRVFADTVFPVTNGMFMEDLEPFAVRAYRLGVIRDEPVELTIGALRPAAVPPRELALPNNWRPNRKNVMPNPSFEEETIPGHADYAFYDARIDSKPGMAKFGDKCLKLAAPGNIWPQVRWNISPQHDSDTPYVWSFWARGKTGGERIQLMSPGPRREIALGSEWKRYESPIVIPKRADKNSPIVFWIYLCNGIAWFDGMQLEQGYESTEYEE